MGGVGCKQAQGGKNDAAGDESVLQVLDKATCMCPFSGSLGSTCPFASILKETAPGVAPKVPEIIDDFYTSLFEKYPETKAFFNPMNQEPPAAPQRKALGNAVVAYATNVDQLENLSAAVDAICNKHCAIGVQPEHYPIVHEVLLDSMKKVLGDDLTPEVATGWSKAVLYLANMLMKEEKCLYANASTRSGGWKGVRDFKIAEIKDVTVDCKEFTLVPADGSTSSLSFKVGQYLTIHLSKPGATPRHYTIVSKPDEPHLKCCIKKLPKGVVSQEMHSLNVGSVIGLSPPFGSFRFRGGPAVLISAGIGITPMMAILRTHKEQVRMMVHVDKSEKSHPYRDEIVESGVTHNFFYTRSHPEMWCMAMYGRRPTIEAYIECFGELLADSDFYLCGPPEFMHSLKEGLEKAKAKAVYMETFGPQLA